MARERIRLTEECSISTKVRYMETEIRDILLRKLQYSPKYMSKESNCLIKKGEFEYMPKELLKIKQFTVKYIAYYFNDEKDYKDFFIRHKNRLISECDYENRCIHYRFAILNDKIPEDFDGMIQHELSHFYQNDNGQTKNENFYEKLRDIINYSNNEIDKCIAYTLYLTFNTEIDAFANQYYAYLRQNNVGFDEIRTNFPNGKGSPYNDFDEHYDDVVAMEKYLNDEHIKEVFGMSIEQLFNRLENADKRYKNKMMKVISLYQKEAFDKHIDEIKDLNMSLAFGLRLNFEMDCYKMGIHETESEFD